MEMRNRYFCDVMESNIYIVPLQGIYSEALSAFDL